MSVYTVSYSDLSKGWTSFWSYEPEWMIGMNSSFYTWKNGELYQHNSNATRNAFYISDMVTNEYFMYPSSIQTIFNQEYAVNKMFKSVSLDSTKSWDADIVTDMSTGHMDSSYFTEKEGMWYSYIRRLDTENYDTKSISTQGIGSMASYVPLSLVLTFSFNIGSGISAGDTAYKISGSNTLVLLGEVASHTSNTITLVSTAVAPGAGDVIVYVKNSQVESYGARGYYMDLTLTNNDTTETEIFAVTSNVFISKP
jgi:hypothetical protein